MPSGALTSTPPTIMAVRRALISYEQAAVAPHHEDGGLLRHPPPLRRCDTALCGSTRPSAGRQLRARRPFRCAIPGYQIHTCLGPSATKAALGEILTGTGQFGRPAVLFSATHGMGGLARWPPGPDRPPWRASVPGLAGSRTDQLGSVPFCSRCASRRPGPRLGDVLFCVLWGGNAAGRPLPAPARRAAANSRRKAFVAALPKGLLAHPEGGALAVIGHIERAWGYSFVSRAGRSSSRSGTLLGRILAGEPIGSR